MKAPIIIDAEKNCPAVEIRRFNNHEYGIIRNLGMKEIPTPTIFLTKTMMFDLAQAIISILKEEK